jgi:hypothetical protein
MSHQWFPQSAHLWVLMVVVVALPPSLAAAQGLEAPGVRARGMAGAFVAVADDATAAWWNPAGLATIRFLDASIDFGSADLNQDEDEPIGNRKVGRWRQGGFFLAVPVLGFSLNRQITEEFQPSATVAAPGGRQEGRTLSSGRVLKTTHVGFTLVQSVTDALVVGGTLRVVRGRAGSFFVAPDTTIGVAFDLADQVPGRSGTRVDADLGAMLVVGRLRVGAAARNLAEASFDTPGGERLRLQRQVRVGVAAGAEPGDRQRAWQVAADADLMAVDGPDGQRRALALGAERWWARRRFAVRAGAQAQTVGDA